MPDIGFLGWGGIGAGAQIDDHDAVAIGSTQPPELAAGAVEEHVSQTATILFYIALGYLVVYVFHVVTF